MDNTITFPWIHVSCRYLVSRDHNPSKIIYLCKIRSMVAGCPFSFLFFPILKNKRCHFVLCGFYGERQFIASKIVDNNNNNKTKHCRCGEKGLFRISKPIAYWKVLFRSDGFLMRKDIVWLRNHSPFVDKTDSQLNTGCAAALCFVPMKSQLFFPFPVFFLLAANKQNDQR